MIHACILDNVTALRQGAELLGGLSAQAYARREADCFDSSAGGHLRHIIEHYLLLLDGLESGEVDYEARARDQRIESDPVYAAAQLRTIEARLGELIENRELRVRAECPSVDAEPVWAASSLMRELEFLLSHTVHHYALVHVICRLGGYPTPTGFGMAPSTLRHLQRKAAPAACAR